MAIKIQLRRGTAANWTSTNPILSDGEVGFESDTGKFKIGRASTAWVDLAYATDLPSEVSGLVSDLSNTVSSHSSATTNVHGIADTNNLETKTGAQNKVDAGVSLAESYTDSELYAHNSSILNIHGIANTAALETKTGAQTKADTAQSAANSYTDTAIANLTDSAPTLLNTLNELAAALNDDPNFATTVANNIATKATLVVDTSTNLTSANAIPAASSFVLESNTGKFKIGNGTTHWTALPYAGTTSDEIVALTADLENYANNMMAYHMAQTTEVHGIANVADLVVSSTLSAHTTATTNVHGIANTADLATQSDILTHNLDTTNVHGIANTADLATKSDIDTHNLDITNVHGIANTALLLTTSDLVNIGNDIALKADINSPTFTGTVALPSTTSIGNVSSAELGYVDGVTSSIQAQLDGKAPTANAAFTGTVTGITKSMVGLGNVDNTADVNKPVSTATQAALDLKADLAGPTFTGTVALPATTSIGNVSATELSYVDGVTSSIQAQLDGKLTSASLSTYAPLASPSFTGTVSGITKSMVGLGNVDNTSDANKPISTATQAALDLKVNSADITELAQDAVGNALGAAGGLVYDDVSGQIYIQTAWTSDGGVYVEQSNNSLVIDRNVVVTKTDTQTLTNKTINTASNDITIVAADISDVTATATELNYVHGVTSAIQTQLNAKAPIANATFTGTLTAPTISATDLTTANLTVTGTQTIVNSTNLAVADSLIYLADSQYSADVLDIGIYGAYGSAGNNAGNHPHTGFVRDASDGIWKLVSGTAEPTDSVVNFTGATYDTMKLGSIIADSATIGNVSNTELQYLDGVTSAVQTQLNAKAPSESPTLANVTVTGSLALPSGSVTSTMIADGTIVNADISASAAIAVSKLAASTISGVTLGSNLNALTIGTGLTGTAYNGSAANTIAIDTSVVATLTDTQTLTNKTITLAAAGITFSDGTVQTVAGVPSLTTISAKTTSYTLSALTERDTIIEINNASATTLTIPLDSTLNFPVGTTLDIIQTGAGQITIAGAGGVTVNATPGLKLRTQWSSATLLKRAANTWLVYGDLSA